MNFGKTGIHIPKGAQTSLFNYRQHGNTARLTHIEGNKVFKLLLLQTYKVSSVEDAFLSSFPWDATIPLADLVDVGFHDFGIIGYTIFASPASIATVLERIEENCPFACQLLDFQIDKLLEKIMKISGKAHKFNWVTTKLPLLTQIDGCFGFSMETLASCFAATRFLLKLHRSIERYILQYHNLQVTGTNRRVAKISPFISCNPDTLVKIVGEVMSSTDMQEFLSTLGGTTQTTVMHLSRQPITVVPEDNIILISDNCNTLRRLTVRKGTQDSTTDSGTSGAGHTTQGLPDPFDRVDLSLTDLSDHSDNDSILCKLVDKDNLTQTTQETQGTQDSS